MAIRRKRIVIVGASFAGLAAAQAISRRYDVVVLDPRREFEWTPNIHEILSGVKQVGELLLDREEVIGRFGHRFVAEAAAGIDVEAREVATAAGSRFGYDACLVATGGVRDRQGIPGAQRHAIDFRTAGDAVAIEDRLDRLLEDRDRVSVAIVGGGVTGVEAVGELLRRHRDEAGMSIHVLEREPEILPGLPAGLAADIRQRTAEFPVHWLTGARIRRITGKSVELESGEAVAADLVVWSAGLSPPAFLQGSPLLPAGHHWVPARQTLQTRAADEVFVAGDCAELPSPLRKQAYYAIEMGEYAGYNLQHYLRRRPMKRFRPSTKPLLVALGDLDTYLVAGDVVLASRYLAAAKEGVYQYYMARMSLALPHTSLTRGIASRFSASLKHLVLPEITSGLALSGIRDSRVVCGPGTADPSSAST